ncbi:MAG: heavy metal translocating P-type ATPase [Paracoccus sp. (in: a-proteobacteria)]|uniref:heavy metal translocating P-type ATPase n=1 Tax=Paracoccus sp. TaxID=267 RepID=UPI0026DF880B|nr:heavy metal translocating P-type ATPase [Paracoccus sp. (in: a-proteobacteria)]MDO5620460.1 heavy metal translocating P-type ATPase [Paracoccus sp. (in: a-proteobacteria)]
MTHLTFEIDGMSCASCAGRAGRALAALPGVADAQVNYATGKAQVAYAAPADLAGMAAALDRAGYPMRLQHSVLVVDGMTCASCTGRVERALTTLPGVTEAHANLASGRVRVTHSGLEPQALAEAVRKAGYEATPAAQAQTDSRATRQDAETARLRRNFLIALALTLPLFIIEMGGHAIPAFHHWLHGLVGQQALWVVQFLLAALVLAVPGRMFFAHGIPALLRGAPEMNSLVALGSGAAFLYSAVATFAPGLLPADARHVYYEAAAVIVTLILMGRWLEARARGQAGAAIRALVEMVPKTAPRLDADGQMQEVPVESLRPGDLLRLLPGARVAVDGIVTEGRGAVDESMLTGEPVPVTKSPGDAVTGGTVNGQAALTYRVTATGADTVLADILHMVDEAQSGRLPVQDLVDRVTRIFVPVVIGLAVLAFALWLAFGPGLAPAVVAGVSVLIIACPCAMGLAVPMSIMVGSGRAAQLGILFRRGDALQRLASARVVGFDKTGTLTMGAPALVDAATSGIDRDQALRLAAAAEAQSEHPLAAAIITAAPRPLPPAQDVTSDPGHGLTATVESHAVLLGNLAALAKSGIAADPALSAPAEKWAAQGATPVHMALDGRHVAAFALADPARPESAAAITALHDLNVQTAMFSGDLPATAQSVGSRLGIDRIEGGLRPEDKLALIRDLGPGSVYVGDGINDAPALAAAETGMAIGTGTDVAIEAADAVLMGADPGGVARAIRLSRAVMRNIRQNLFWAFAYNVALIPVAMGALVPFGGPQLSPMLGAGAMALSSVFVVTNALRLRGAA